MISYKILIVEDEPLIAEDVKDFLISFNFEVTTIAYNKAQALNSLRINKPDLVLLDINLGDNQDGIIIAEIINKDFQTPFLFLTSYASKTIIDQVKHTLPMGYVVKPFDKPTLFTAIEIAISNYKKIHTKVELTLNLVNSKISNPISEREFTILLAIYYGNTNKQIAEANFVSINTVKFHIKNIFEKLDTHSKPETILWIRSVLF
ncbi:MAG: response regulator transcription factor [Flavobacteriaceae bacterium]|nr:response regulator transcription factor [Flavobacteriaceae bacterium]